MNEEKTMFPIKEPEKTAVVISKFISDKVNESKTSGVIIGLSGGLDSSLTAYLCEKSLKKDQILGIIMPTVTTPYQDVEDAVSVAENIGIDYEIIHVDHLIEPFNELCAHAVNKSHINRDDRELANANLKARIRMMVLYYHANTLNRLVVGTGNRTELLVGYFTKHGDGGVDVLPIGDLYKTDVRKLASYIGVDRRIIEKAPTAGLWEGQTDEKELGIKYELLDQILYFLVDEKLNVREIAENLEIPVEEVLRIEGMVKSSEHKLKSAPIPEVI